MKIKIHMKDPDGVFDSIVEAAKQSVSSIEGLDGEERQSLIEGRQTTITENLSRWLKYSECITIEFDTNAGTATVLEAK